MNKNNKRNSVSREVLEEMLTNSQNRKDFFPSYFEPGRFPFDFLKLRQLINGLAISDKKIIEVMSHNSFDRSFENIIENEYSQTASKEKSKKEFSARLYNDYLNSNLIEEILYLLDFYFFTKEKYPKHYQKISKEMHIVKRYEYLRVTEKKSQSEAIDLIMSETDYSYDTIHKYLKSGQIRNNKLAVKPPKKVIDDFLSKLS